MIEPESSVFPPVTTNGSITGTVKIPETVGEAPPYPVPRCLDLVPPRRLSGANGFSRRLGKMDTSLRREQTIPARFPGDRQ